MRHQKRKSTEWKERMSKIMREKYLQDKDLLLFQRNHLARLRYEGRNGFRKGNRCSKGQIPWNKGKTAFQDPRIAAYALKKKGEGNSNWRGGVAGRIRDSKYREWRSEVFKRDRYRCQACGIRSKELCADHVLCWAHHPRKRFDISNGRTLCKTCHRRTSTYGFHKCKE